MCCAGQIVTESSASGTLPVCLPCEVLANYVTRVLRERSHSPSTPGLLRAPRAVLTY